MTFHPKYPKWDQNLHYKARRRASPKAPPLSFVNAAEVKLSVRRASSVLWSDQPHTDWQAYTINTWKIFTWYPNTESQEETRRNVSSDIQTLGSNTLLNVRRKFLRWLDAGYRKKHSLHACWYSFSNIHYANDLFWSQSTVASHANVFRKARNEIRAPLKTPAWEAKSTAVVSYFSHLSRDFYTLMSFEIRGKYEVRWCELLLGLRVNKNKCLFEFQSYSLCF